MQIKKEKLEAAEKKERYWIRLMAIHKEIPDDYREVLTRKYPHLKINSIYNTREGRQPDLEILGYLEDYVEETKEKQQAQQ